MFNRVSSISKHLCNLFEDFNFSLLNNIADAYDNFFIITMGLLALLPMRDLFSLKYICVLLVLSLVVK